MSALGQERDCRRWHKLPKSWPEKSRPGQFVWYSRTDKYFFQNLPGVPKKATARRGSIMVPGIVNNTQEPNDQTSHPHPHPQNRGGSRCWHRLRRPNLKVYI